MGLCLKDVMFRVRSQLGELDQYNWSDTQLVFACNDVIRELSSTGGALTKFERVTLQAVNGSDVGLQEAPLDQEVDKVKACKYFSGFLYDLEPHDWKTLQTGAVVGSIPRWYYLKTSTTDMTPQTASTGDITQIPIAPNTAYGSVYRTVIGCWPIPPELAQLEVWYSYFHPYMQDPTDPIEIPPQFMRTIIYGVMENQLRIEKAHDEADGYLVKYEKGMNDYRIYCATQRNADKPSRYGNTLEPWRVDPSSSVIVISPTGS